MTIRVFVGSTRKDLDADCRPEVLNAFRLASVESASISMEDWATEYRPAVDVCREKVQESTHYLGVFGFYRGWVPAGYNASITELELTWALESKKPIAIFLPHITEPKTKPFAQELEERAKADQSPEELAAQQSFIKTVLSSGTVEFFDRPSDLGLRTLRRLYLWGRPFDQLPSAPTARARRPSESDLPKLGRLVQIAAFDAALQRMAAPGARGVACILVHGASSYGQDKLVARLRTTLEGDAPTQPRHCVVGFPVWRQSGLPSLLQAIAQETRSGVVASVPEAAAQVGQLLALSDVILEVPRLQQYAGGVAGFLTEFWQPLVAALPSDTPYRLFCLATHEGDPVAAAGWAPFVQSPEQPVDPAHLIVLPALTPFTLEEVARFVRPYLPPEAVADAAQVASALLNASSGGVPQLLFSVLLDASNWQ